MRFGLLLSYLAVGHAGMITLDNGATYTTFASTYGRVYRGQAGGVDYYHGNPANLTGKLAVMAPLSVILIGATPPISDATQKGNLLPDMSNLPHTCRPSSYWTMTVADTSAQRIIAYSTALEMVLCADNNCMQTTAKYYYELADLGFIAVLIFMPLNLAYMAGEFWSPEDRYNPKLKIPLMYNSDFFAAVPVITAAMGGVQHGPMINTTVVITDDSATGTARHFWICDDNLWFAFLLAALFSLNVLFSFFVVYKLRKVGKVCSFAGLFVFLEGILAGVMRAYILCFFWGNITTYAVRWLLESWSEVISSVSTFMVGMQYLKIVLRLSVKLSRIYDVATLVLGFMLFAANVGADYPNAGSFCNYRDYVSMLDSEITDGIGRAMKAGLNVTKVVLSLSIVLFVFSILVVVHRLLKAAKAASSATVMAVGVKMAKFASVQVIALVVLYAPGFFWYNDFSDQPLPLKVRGPGTDGMVNEVSVGYIVYVWFLRWIGMYVVSVAQVTGVLSMQTSSSSSSSASSSSLSAGSV